MEQTGKAAPLIHVIINQLALGIADLLPSRHYRVDCFADASELLGYGADSETPALDSNRWKPYAIYALAHSPGGSCRRLA